MKLAAFTGVPVGTVALPDGMVVVLPLVVPVALIKVAVGVSRPEASEPPDVEVVLAVLEESNPLTDVLAPEVDGPVPVGRSVLTINVELADIVVSSGPVLSAPELPPGDVVWVEIALELLEMVPFAPEEALGPKVKALEGTGVALPGNVSASVAVGPVPMAVPGLPVEMSVEFQPVNDADGSPPVDNADPVVSFPVAVALVVANDPIPVEVELKGVVATLPVVLFESRVPEMVSVGNIDTLPERLPERLPVPVAKPLFVAVEFHGEVRGLPEDEGAKVGRPLPDDPASEAPVVAVLFKDTDGCVRVGSGTPDAPEPALDCEKVIEVEPAVALDDWPAVAVLFQEPPL